MKIAVIGSGISGLAAAWLLSQRHDVTLYEKDARLGGHANTVEVATPAGPLAVDTGFIVYNLRNYPNLMALFDHVGVKTEPSDMSFGVSLENGGYEYGGGTFASLIAQKRNLIRPRFWHMLLGILRFYRQAPAALNELKGRHLSLGDFLAERRFGTAFEKDHLLPMPGAIWSAAPETLRDYPAAAFVQFFVNHGLLDLTNRPVWRTVSGGSRNYVTTLAKHIRGRILCSTPVAAVHRSETGIVVKSTYGRDEQFDHVVFATHADQALNVLVDPSPKEKKLLGAFTYTKNVAVLHTDDRLMPKRRSVWSSWNYMGFGAQPAGSICVTYWMNKLQSLATDQNVFVTLNPAIEPRAHTILHRDDYEHPLFNDAALAAQTAVGRIQGQRNTWHCGAHLGSGFHEDGLRSGLAVAEVLGGIKRPWHVDAAAGYDEWPAASAKELVR